MSARVLVTPVLAQNNDPKVARRIANFLPSFWGDRFLTSAPEDTVTKAYVEEQIEQLKEEVMRELKAISSDASQLLNFIDSIQRLGLAYQFEREIKDALQEMNEKYNLGDDNDDLATASLRFRLLRQEGYRFPSDLFNKFKDNEGNFKESLTADLPGMLALYEAVHLGVHGEDILDEALAFTTAHLQSIAADLTNPLSAQVARALKRPIHKALTRVEARHYISIYQEDGSHNKTLLKLAKLDFNLLQSLHKKELNELYRWWKDLDFETKLPFARNRLVECHFWASGIHFEPQYVLGRKLFAQIIAITSVIDDIYDAYGAFEELQLFTEAIERWNMNIIDQLPDYMKWCYQALLNFFDEVEEQMTKQGKSHLVHYAKTAMKELVQCYFEEAKWLNQEYIPTVDEYMSNALVTSAYPMLAIVSFLGMGDLVNKEAIDWVSSNPKMVRASSTICRLMDDIVSHEFEQKRGHVASGVECYMKEYGVCKEKVYDEFNKQVANAWKDMNEEFLKPKQMPMPLLTRVMNFSRVVDLYYKDDDEYTLVGKETRDLIASILIHPVPV